MSKSKRAMSADPFLQSLEGRDRKQPLTRFQACGFLNIGTTKLDAWRKAGRVPPAWIKEGRDVLYPIGELLDYVDAKVAETKAGATPSPARLPVVPNQRIRSKQPLLTARQRDEYGLLEPILRGGRRAGIRHSSFAQFLAAGAPTDEWVFLLVPDRHMGSYRRPVDLTATLDMPLNALRGAQCEQLTLEAYLARMSSYLIEGPHQAQAARRAEMALANPPPLRPRKIKIDRRRS